LNELTPIEYQNQRILTTQQLAESYGTDTDIINQNYNRNNQRYIQGKHFFWLESAELKEFKATLQNEGNLSDEIKFAPKLQLWTEKGAWLHAKSLGTDEAWNAYESLVDDYYSIKGNAQVVSQAELSLQIAQCLVNQERQIKALESNQEIQGQTIQNIKDALAPTDKTWRKWVIDELRKIAYTQGGEYREITEESYELLEKRGRCKLSIRAKNRQDRLREQGATKTAINNINRLDGIESDPRLKEIYSAIIKELSIKYLA